MGPRQHPQLPIDPAESVPNGGGGAPELSANLSIGVPPDDQLQDPEFAVRERNRVPGPRRWGLLWRDRRRLLEPFALKQLLDQALEPGFSLQQFAVESFQRVNTPTIRHAAHASTGMVTRDQLSGVKSPASSYELGHT
jgi:hypothetical protein